MKKIYLINLTLSFATLAMVDPEKTSFWAFFLILAWFVTSILFAKKILPELWQK